MRTTRTTTRDAPAALPRGPGAPPAAGGPGSVGPPATNAPRAPDPRRPDSYNCSQDRARRDASSQGRPLRPRPPPTLATQLNNGDIAGRAAAPRPPLPLTPAASSWGGGQPGAGSGRGGARAWLPRAGGGSGGGGGLLPTRHCLEGRARGTARPRKGSGWGQRGEGRGKGSAGPALTPPPPPPPAGSGARGGKSGGAGSPCSGLPRAQLGQEEEESEPWTLGTRLCKLEIPVSEA